LLPSPFLAHSCQTFLHMMCNASIPWTPPTSPD
jgi:hypothetical protein